MLGEFDHEPCMKAYATVNYSNSQPRHKTKIRSLLHAPAALLPEVKLHIHKGQVAGKDRVPLWTVYIRDKILASIE
jgi:hypothetical protein